MSSGVVPVGRALNVASDGSDHPVYRSGFALSVRLPEPKPIPEPAASEASVEATTAAVPEPEPAAHPEGTSAPDHDRNEPETASSQPSASEAPDYEI